MTVFKSFLKILKKKSVGVLIYIIVFLIITLVNINSSDQNMNKAIGNKVNSKTRISVQNDFSENPTYSGLEKYLDDTFKTVKVKNDRKTITESLLNGYVNTNGLRTQRGNRLKELICRITYIRLSLT